MPLHYWTKSALLLFGTFIRCLLIFFSLLHTKALFLHVHLLHNSLRSTSCEDDVRVASVNLILLRVVVDLELIPGTLGVRRPIRALVRFVINETK